MKKTIRNAICAVIATSAVTAMAAYPEKPLTIIEPWAPGSAGDIPMRIIAELAEKRFGQPIVVQNIQGGNGGTAQLAALKADPDGYTVMNAWVATQVMAPIFNPNIGYTYDDFDSIVQTNANLFMLVVRSDHPANNAQEFVQWLKDKDKKVNASVCGFTGLAHIVLRRFHEVSDTMNDFNPIPFSDCEAENLKALLGGVTEYAITGIGAKHTFGDELKYLALFMPERAALFPELPTAKEQGYELGLGTTGLGWSGLVVPKGLPQERLNFLRQVFDETVRSDEYINKMKSVKQTPLYGDYKEFQQLWEDTDNLLKPEILKLIKK
ncbi:tripartite tricarboxylate transporter substrate binding protein [Psychromonas sp. SA13A]|uniref:Bug family tripartite tricarboxylate transporter substrate binding protein n=1 Tax=Psychromonas sp. SA13A TaxID=2686346 RepID=UPI00140D6D5D|nr:tripartite tricarboxylate transporter substrate binding protein [Psychromonas sp. SA13A]